MEIFKGEMGFFGHSLGSEQVFHPVAGDGGELNVPFFSDSFYKGIGQSERYTQLSGDFRLGNPAIFFNPIQYLKSISFFLFHSSCVKIFKL